MIIGTRIVERSTNLIDLQIPNLPGITHYRLLCHSTLNGAFAGGSTVFTVRARDTFASISVHRRNHAHFQDEQINTDVTRMRFDLNDYSLPANNIPLDDFTAFFQVQVSFDHAATFVTRDPIVVIPPVVTYGSHKLAITLVGTAPAVGATRGLNPPAGSMVVQLPGIAQTLSISNQDGGNELLVAFGEGETLVVIDSGERHDFDHCRVKYLFLTADGVAVDFSLNAAVRAD